MTPLDLAAIEKAAKEATQGTWQRSGIQRNIGGEVGLTVDVNDKWFFWSPLGRSHNHQAQCIRDMDFIALANPATILALCERIRELEGALTDIPKTWELSYGEVDDYEGSEHRWRVHNRSGNRSDREWDLIGQGDTPADALRDALITKKEATP